MMYRRLSMLKEVQHENRARTKNANNKIWENNLR